MLAVKTRELRSLTACASRVDGSVPTAMTKCGTSEGSSGAAVVAGAAVVVAVAAVVVAVAAVVVAGAAVVVTTAAVVVAADPLSAESEPQAAATTDTARIASSLVTILYLLENTILPHFLFDYLAPNGQMNLHAVV